MISPSSFIIGEVQAQKVEEEEEKENVYRIINQKI